MSLQKSASSYNLLNSVLLYCLWLAPSYHAGRVDVAFYISAFGDTDCIHHDNKDLSHEVCTLPRLFQGFLGTCLQSQIRSWDLNVHHLNAPFSHGQSKEPSVHPVLHRHIYAVYPFTLAFVQSVCITAEESRSVKIFLCSVFVF